MDNRAINNYLPNQKNLMEKTLNFITDNWPWISAILLSVAARLIPTKKNYDIFEMFVRIVDKVIPNNRVQTNEEKIKERNLNDITRRPNSGTTQLLLLLLFVSFSSLAQNNYNAKSIYFTNADSATVKTNATNCGNCGFIYYNKQHNQPKFRVYQDSVWYDLLGGSGGISGLTTPQVLFATSPTTIGGNAGLTFNVANGRLDSNPTLSLKYTRKIASTTVAPVPLSSYYEGLAQGTITGGVRDVVYHHGYNLSPDGAQVNTSESAFGYAIESNYNGDTEYHLKHITFGGTINRVLSMNINNTTGTGTSFWNLNTQEWRPSNSSNYYMAANSSGLTLNSPTNVGTTLALNGSTVSSSGIFQDAVGGLQFTSTAAVGASRILNFSGYIDGINFTGSTAGLMRQTVNNTSNSTSAFAGNTYQVNGTVIGYVFGTPSSFAGSFAANGLHLYNGNSGQIYSNNKHNFIPTATTAGLNWGSLSGDPSSVSNGDTWYNSSTNKFRGRQNGSNVDIVGSGSGTVTSVGLVAGNNISISGTSPITTSGSFTASAIPSGSDTQIQLNNSGSFSGDAGLTYLSSTNSLVNTGSSYTVTTTPDASNWLTVNASGNTMTFNSNTISTNTALVLNGTTSSGFTGVGITTGSNSDIAFTPNGSGDIKIVSNGAGGSYIIVSGLPTSCSGVPTGGLANVSGVLNICP